MLRQIIVFKGSSLIILITLIVGLFILPAEMVNAAPVDCYWVGDSGVWSDATNHWATVSGGVPNAANLPDASSNVHFDANSFTIGGRSVTIGANAYCHDMDWTGATGVPTLARTSGGLYISGSMTFITSMQITYNGTIYFTATGLGETITTGGHDMNSVSFTFQGVGGGWTVQDNFEVKQVSVTAACSLDTNGTFVSLATGYGFNISGTGANITLGASYVSCEQWNVTAATWTLDAGTSEIHAYSNFFGGGKTYYDVYLVPDTNGKECQVTGTNTFHNLIITAGVDVDGTRVKLAADQTVTGNFSAYGGYGGGGAYQALVMSSTYGTARTITSNYNDTFYYASFMDITAAGAASWDFSAKTSVGDAGGNTGITFTPASNKYWVNTSGGDWNDQNSWALSSGGAAPAKPPLPQDNVYIDANSITTPGSTITVDAYCMGGNVDYTSVLNEPTISISYNSYILGSLTLIEDITYSMGTKQHNFWGRTSCNLTSGGQSMYYILLEAPGGKLTLQDNLDLYRLHIKAGEIDFNDNDVTISYTFTTAGTPTITLGNGTISFTNSTLSLTVFEPGSATVNADNSTIELTSASNNQQVFAGGSKTYNNLLVAGSGNFTAVISGSNSFDIIKINAEIIDKNIHFYNGTTTNITDMVRLDSSTNYVTLKEYSSGMWALTKDSINIISLDYMRIENSTATPYYEYYAGFHSINAGGNHGWVFSDYSSGGEALYYATIGCTNNCSAALTNVWATFDLLTQNLINLGWLNSSASDCTIRTVGGTDVAFQPSVNSSYPWIMQIPEIPSNTIIRQILYFDGATTGILRYFPGITGMTTADSPSLELSDNGSVEITGFVDTTAGNYKYIVLHDNSYAILVSDDTDGEIRAGALSASIYQSPTGNNDPDSGWSSEASAYDGDTGTHASANVTAAGEWTSYLELTRASTKIHGVRFHNSTFGTLHLDLFEVGLYFDGAWHEIYEGDINDGLNSWYSVIVGDNVTDNCTSARLRFRDNGDGTGYPQVDEFQFITEPLFTTEVSVIGVDTGEITVALQATNYGTNADLQLIIESTTEDTASLSANFTDSSDNITSFLNNAMPYVEYQEFTVNGTQQQYITWQYATTFTDQSGNGNDAVPSFRTETSSSCIIPGTLTIEPTEEATVSEEAATEWPDIMEEAPALPETTYTEEESPGFFFAPLVSTIWGLSGLPDSFFWYNFAMFIVMFAGIFTYYFFAKNNTQALLFKTIAMSAFLIFFALPGINIIGFYVFIYFALFSFGILIFSRDFGW